MSGLSLSLLIFGVVGLAVGGALWLSYRAKQKRFTGSVKGTVRRAETVHSARTRYVRVEVEFEVEGRRYSQQLDLDNGEYAAGDDFWVSYDPGNPGSVFVEHQARQRAIAFLAGGGAALLMSLFTMQG